MKAAFTRPVHHPRMAARGASLDAVQISMRGIFAEGQAYVALSRARTLEGLLLEELLPGVIRANQPAVQMI